MALSTHRASPSLSWDESPPRWKFDVFLSFRGEDTRWGFISHLYRELEFWRALKIFKDNRELEIEASISPELLRAIEQSHLAIVVLSPDYASSTWCLDELSKIIVSMETGDKRILSVFFNVDPSDVRHQRSSFADAFAKHEVKFSNQIEKVERWREALRKVANLAGWDAKNYKIPALRFLFEVFSWHFPYEIFLLLKEVDPFLHLVEEYKLQAVKAGPDHPTYLYGSKEDDNLALKSLSQIVITEEQSRESFASAIVKSLDNLSEASLKTIKMCWTHR